MNARSEAALLQVNPELAKKVRAAAATLEAAGTYLLVVSGYRSADEQNVLYAQGRTLMGHIVTNAKAGHSMHNYGLAVDVVPYLNRENGPLNWKPATEQFQAMVAALKAQGLAWGGDWKHLADFDHFQLGGLPQSPTTLMLADYNVGMNTIWGNVADGKYAEKGA